MGIPKVIHISWINKEILFTSQNPLAINGVQNMKRLNPEYVIQISDDCDVKDYVQSCIPNDDWLLLKDKNIVEIIDLWRLLKMFHEGGIYTDIDRLCNIPFRDIIKEDDVCLLPTYFTADFSQDIMISQAGQKIHEKAIELNLSRRQSGCSDVLSLGPLTYFHAITLTLCNEQKNRFLEDNEWLKTIKDVESNKGYRTFLERPVADIIYHVSVMYKYDAKFDIGNGGTKKDLYTESKVRHWTEDESSFGNKIYGR
jgi:hypothetical protein